MHILAAEGKDSAADIAAEAAVAEQTGLAELGFRYSFLSSLKLFS